MALLLPGEIAQSRSPRNVARKKVPPTKARPLGLASEVGRW